MCPSLGSIVGEASEAEPELPQSFVANTIEVLAFLALQDKGITFLPTFLVRDALASGALQIVLDDFIDQTVTFWILWPASRYASPKLRVFIGYVSEHLQI